MKYKIWYLFNDIETDKAETKIIEKWELEDFEKSNNVKIIKKEEVY